MKNRIIALLLLLGTGLSAQQNFNMTKLANVQFPEGCNDIWGYVDENGTEYAILGTRQATAIFNLADPANPKQVAYIPGSLSTWRDMKTWKNHAYVTADAGNDGLLIIDLAKVADDSVTWNYWKPQLTVGSTTAIMERCHNLWIDENGYAYLSGCNPLNSGGVLIFDVHTTPGQPVLVGHVEPVYSHDNYTRGDTVYSANLQAGFYVTDVSDKSQHVTLATQETSMDFTHNVWLSDDGNYLFTTDERSGGYVDAYDISDLDAIFMTDKFRPKDTEGTGVIPHNTHYYKGYNVVSWYTDGVKVIDSHKPDNLVEIANYDTYTGTQTGFQGCWGTYPFLPSELVLASDINTCLWVLGIEYKRAAYLEGTVINSITKQPVQGAAVTIKGVQPNQEISGPDGGFKTGSNVGGTLTVRAEKSGYFPKEIAVSMTEAQVTDITIELLPLQTTTISGKVIDENTGLPVEGARVRYRALADPSLVFQGTSDAAGDYTLSNIYVGDYEVIAGAWSYDYATVSALPVGMGPSVPTIALPKKYRDDFLFNYAWTVDGNAAKGAWERAVPEPTVLGNTPLNPPTDVPDDLGEICYSTGPQAGSGGGDFDLDDGISRLTSPTMDLSTYTEPVIRFSYWFVNTGGNGTPNDTLKVYLLEGSQEKLIRTYTGISQGWKRDSILVNDHATDLGQIRFRITAQDLPGSGHIVEAGLDAFVVEETAGSSSTEDLVGQRFQFGPNPFLGSIQLIDRSGDTTPVRFTAMDATGRIIGTGMVSHGQSIGHSWPAGPCIILVEHAGGMETHRTLKTGN